MENLCNSLQTLFRVRFRRIQELIRGPFFVHQQPLFGQLIGMAILHAFRDLPSHLRPQEIYPGPCPNSLQNEMGKYIVRKTGRSGLQLPVRRKDRTASAHTSDVQPEDLYRPYWNKIPLLCLHAHRSQGDALEQKPKTQALSHAFLNTIQGRPLPL